MKLLRSTIGLLAVAALAGLAMAAPAAAEIAPFALETNVSGLAVPIASDIVRTGPAVLASTDTVIVPSEVGTPSRDAVCVPAGFEAAIAMLDAGTPFAPPEVGAHRDLVRG